MGMKSLFTGVAGVALVIAAALYVTQWEFVPYLYAAAAAVVAVAFLTRPYKGPNFRLKRLNIQQAIAALLLPVSAALMFQGRNEWVVCLLVSAILLGYVVWIRDYEEKKNRDGDHHQPAK
jgi:hypothetical protein